MGVKRSGRRRETPRAAASARVVRAPAARPAPCSCVPAALAEAARRDPAAIALEDRGRRRTYARLVDDVARCAQGLHELGVRPGHRVAIIAGPSTETVIALHAVLRIGAIAVVHDPESTSRELRRAFEDHAAIVAVVARGALAAVDDLPADLHPKAVVAIEHIASTTDRLRSAARAMGRPGLLARAVRSRLRGGAGAPCEPAIPFAQLLASSPLPPDHRCPSPRDLALLQYTIGPDGDQVGAMLTHGNLVANAAHVEELWGRGGEGGICSTLPLHEPCGAPLALVAPLLAGRPLVLASTAHEVIAATARVPIDLLATTAALLVSLCAAREAAPAEMPHLPRAVVHERPVPAALAAHWASLAGAPIAVGYARAECGIALAADYDPARPAALGAPLPGVRVGRDADGLLRVAGPQVFHGYWNRPDETAHVLSGDGWTTTGDAVGPIADGLELRHRLRPGIETPDGRLVSPREIASAMLGHPAVADTLVRARPLPDGGAAIEALVVVREGTWAEEDELRAWAAARLAPAKIPARILRVRSLPLLEAAASSGGSAQ